jgi:uncharacterized alpha-E superfamily protein
VLSRIAESLYWMGRYLERADDTARLLDVHVHRVLAESVEENVGLALLGAMGFDAVSELHGDVDLWRATDLLAYDVDKPSSVAGSLVLAHTNARGLRETLASEVWETLNRTHHDLGGQIRSARVFGPHLFFRWVRDRVALVSGLVDTVVLHDDGWRFLTLGRSLERVDMTARLLRGVADHHDPARWSAVLVSCGAYDAYLRTHGGEVTRSRALALLLQSPDLPRSVAFALHQAEQCLHEIAAPTGTPDSAVRIIGRARAEVTYSGPDDLSPSCTHLLERLQDACRHADDEVRARYFRRADLIEWRPELTA